MLAMLNLSRSVSHTHTTHTPLAHLPFSVSHLTVAQASLISKCAKKSAHQHTRAHREVWKYSVQTDGGMSSSLFVCVRTHTCCSNSAHGPEARWQLGVAWITALWHHPFAQTNFLAATSPPFSLPLPLCPSSIYVVNSFKCMLVTRFDCYHDYWSAQVDIWFSLVGGAWLNDMHY